MYFLKIGISVISNSPTKKNDFFPNQLKGSNESSINFLFQGSVCDGLGYVIIIIIFSVLYNAIKFFEFTTSYTRLIINRWHHLNANNAN